MRFLILLIFTVLPTSAQGQTPQRCLNYEPAMATLTGTLTRRTFPGAPNYSSIKKGDAREVLWVVRLPKPICVVAAQDAPGENRVFDLQLVFSDPAKDYRSYRRWLGKTVVVSGKLFHSHTGHHHTRVLIDVDSISTILARP